MRTDIFGKTIIEARRFISKNSPTILTILGTIGVGATGFLTVKSTIKAIDIIKKKEKEKECSLTSVEKVKFTAASYIPPVASAAVTIGLIWGSNILNKKKQLSLLSAYAFVDKAFKDYRKKAKELYGEEGTLKILDDISLEKSYNAEAFPGMVSGNQTGSKILFYDEFSGRYFETEPYNVILAEQLVKDEFIDREAEFVGLNEFYEWIGVPKMQEFNYYGWSKSVMYNNGLAPYVGFEHERVELDDRLVCYIIKFVIEPSNLFYDYYPEE